MENPFKSILQDEKLPDTIKNKVLDEVALIKLTIEIADLVTIKYPDIFGSFVNKNQNKKNIKDKLDKSDNSES